jgi:hypothetical protein
MKIFNIILTVLFVLFAVVQYNDPDPWLWVPIYLFPAVTCGFAATGQYNKWAILIGLVPITLYMVSYIPDFMNWINKGTPSITGTMKAENPIVELTREFGGLVICVGVLAWQYFKAAKLKY